VCGKEVVKMFRSIVLASKRQLLQQRAAAQCGWPQRALRSRNGAFTSSSCHNKSVVVLAGNAKSSLPFGWMSVQQNTRALTTTASTTASTTSHTLATSQQQSSSSSAAAAAAAASIATKQRYYHHAFFSSTQAAIVLASLSIGYGAGSYNSNDNQHPHNHLPPQKHVLPDGLPRTCCEEDAEASSATTTAQTPPLTPAQAALPAKLAKICGSPNHVLAGNVFTPETLPFLKGMRLGRGAALCIVTPPDLHEVVDCVQAIVDANCVLIVQGQNTGLTGGSVPRPTSRSPGGAAAAGGGGAAAATTEPEHRPVVILSMKHLDRIIPIDQGKRVVCLAGVGLARLQQFLQKHFPHRECHSQLGSTFLNPTTAAGVALGSGGTQLRKGPAYTERALYLTISQNKWKENQVHIVNTLGLKGMDDRTDLPPERRRKMDSVAYRLNIWSRWIEQYKSGYSRPDCPYQFVTASNDPHGALPASASKQYREHVCQLDDNVSRYNADTSGPDFNRSEGKVVILATVHDTFATPREERHFWISFDSLETALAFRREVCLDNPQDLPISLEYMDRDAFDVVDSAGRAMALSIQLLGMTSPLLRQLWNAKLWIESVLHNPVIVDHWLYRINHLVPSVLPTTVQDHGKQFDHHVAMTVGDFGTGNLERILQRLKAFEQKYNVTADGRKQPRVWVYEATSRNQAHSMNAFRFVAASAFRTWCIGQGAQGFSVDYALPKNGGAAPALQLKSQTHIENDKKEKKKDNEDDCGCSALPIKRMRYSHFGCNVVHEDLAYAPGVDIQKAKYEFKKHVEYQCGGKLPAEHGHGTEYPAPLATQERWKRMDPLNVCNPGVGGLSDRFAYKEQHA